MKYFFSHFFHFVLFLSIHKCLPMTGWEDLYWKYQKTERNTRETNHAQVSSCFGMKRVHISFLSVLCIFDIKWLNKYILFHLQNKKRSPWKAHELMQIITRLYCCLQVGCHAFDGLVQKMASLLAKLVSETWIVFRSYFLPLSCKPPP